MNTRNNKTSVSEVSVGLDIGSYSVKSIVVASSKGQIEVKRPRISLISKKSSVEDILTKMELSSFKRIRIALSGPSVVIRRIKMPLMTPAELKGAIRFEAESHIPFSIDDCVLDFHVLSQDFKKNEMSLLLVAVSRDHIDARYKLLAALGLAPEIIDMDIFSLLNSFETLASEGTEECHGILNVGHNVSSFAIVQEGKPYFVREIAQGGRQVTQALAVLKSISEEESDRIKIEKPSSETPSLQLATEKGFEALVEEIRNSINYVESELGEEVGRIWLSGGGAQALGAPEHLSMEIGRKVLPWDNTVKMASMEDEDQKFMAEHAREMNVALGLALRGMGKK